MGSLHSPLRPNAQHSSHPHDIAGRHGELERLVDTLESAVHRLSYPPDRLRPAEVLFDALAHDLAGSVAGVTNRSSIDGAATPTRRVAGHVRRHAALVTVGDEVSRVVALVGCDRLTVCSGDGVEHRQCC